MKTLRSFVRRLRNVFRREELDRDLSDELASHLAMHMVTRFLPLMATGQETDCLSAGTTAPFNATLGVISSGFLATMQIPLLEGRDFISDDGPNSPPVVLVSQNLAKHLWPQSSAVGQHLRFGCDNDAKTAEVVGVVRETSIRSLGELPQAHFYRPFAQRYTGLATLVVET